MLTWRYFAITSNSVNWLSLINRDYAVHHKHQVNRIRRLDGYNYVWGRVWIQNIINPGYGLC